MALPLEAASVGGLFHFEKSKSNRDNCAGLFLNTRAWGFPVTQVMRAPSITFPRWNAAADWMEALAD
jgi:hypothetical protein